MIAAVALGAAAEVGVEVLAAPRKPSAQAFGISETPRREIAPAAPCCRSSRIPRNPSNGSHPRRPRYHHQSVAGDHTARHFEPQRVRTAAGMREEATGELYEEMIASVKEVSAATVVKVETAVAAVEAAGVLALARLHLSGCG